MQQTWTCKRCGAQVDHYLKLSPTRHNCPMWQKSDRKPRKLVERKKEVVGQKLVGALANVIDKKAQFGTAINGTLKELVPKTDKKYIAQKLGNSTDLEIIRKTIQNKLNSLLLGETGTGKTHCLRHLAYQMEIPYMRVNLNGGTTPEDLIGQWIPKKDGPGFEWADGVMTKMIRHGGLLVVDEINAANAEILFILHSLLDDERKVVLVQKDGEVVTAHTDFVFAATMNPTGYEGTKQLNLALFDRFDVVIEFKNNAERFAPQNMREAVRKIKEGIAAGNIMGTISTRGIQQFIKNRELFGLDVAKEMFLQKFERLGREVVEHLLDTISEGQ